MTEITVELLTDQGSFAILRLPARRFPGVVFQGDSLKSLYEHAQEAAAASAGSGAEEVVADLVVRLGEILEHYIRTLDEADIPLPFSRPTG